MIASTALDSAFASRVLAALGRVLLTRRCPPDRTRFPIAGVYYASADARQQALDAMMTVRDEMQRVSGEGEARLPQLGDLDDDDREAVLQSLLWTMADGGKIGLINSYSPDAFGLDLPERLLWEAAVVRQSIEQEEGWATGRGSEPAFQELNLHATRDPALPGVRPKTVLWQHDHARPMNPRGLLIAYEEESIKPVCSDIDAFMIGSRGVSFAPMPADQLSLIDWSCTQIESILRSQSGRPSGASWTKRWLEVLKKASDSGFKPEMPPYGFGDPTTYSIMQSVAQTLFVSGAVRHGAECSNFYFPQELDSDFLITWEGFGTVPWRYFNQFELRSFLSERIEEGFAFPLNPKWILCDEGWLPIFEALLSSPHAQQAMQAWFPTESGLRERIRSIAYNYPDGFELPDDAHDDIDPSMAEYELRRHETLRRAKQKLRAIHRLRSLLNDRRRRDERDGHLCDNSRPRAAPNMPPPQLAPPPPPFRPVTPHAATHAGTQVGAQPTAPAMPTPLATPPRGGGILRRRLSGAGGAKPSDKRQSFQLSGR